VAIRFATTGFEQRQSQGLTGWVQPHYGDQVTLWYSDEASDLPAPLEDVARLRHDLALRAAEVGCLIEAHVTQLCGVPAVYQVIKLPFPNQPTGQAFLASFTVPKAKSFVLVKIQALESGITGLREAVLMDQIGFEHWVMPHPYAPELQGRLPFHTGDDPRFDPQFADHPLSRVRALAYHFARTAQIDSWFAALPPFSP
jgi:hypothetical protein